MNLSIIHKHVRLCISRQLNHSKIINDGKQIKLGTKNIMNAFIELSETNDYKDLIKESIYQAQIYNIAKIFHQLYTIEIAHIKDLINILSKFVEWEEIKEYLISFLSE